MSNDWKLKENILCLAIRVVIFSQNCLGSVQFSCSVVSKSLQPHGQRYIRLPCPSPILGACSNSCPSSWWCHPTMLTPSPPQSFLASGSFPMNQFFCIRWPKYWSFSINRSSEVSGLISFRMDWLGLLAVQGTIMSLLQHHSSKASVLWCSTFFIVQLTSIHDYWKHHSFD